MYEWIDPFEEPERLRAGFAAYIESAQAYQQFLRERIDALSYAAMSPTLRMAYDAAREVFP